MHFSDSFGTFLFARRWSITPRGKKSQNQALLEQDRRGETVNRRSARITIAIVVACLAVVSLVSSAIAQGGTAATIFVGTLVGEKCVETGKLKPRPLKCSQPPSAVVLHDPSHRLFGYESIAFGLMHSIGLRHAGRFRG